MTDTLRVLESQVCDHIFNQISFIENQLKELEIKGIKRLVIENSIVTSSAQEYAKDKNIEIIKRR